MRIGPGEREVTVKRDGIEAEGNTIDEAITAGLRELGIEREQAQVEILNDAKRSLLGFGGQKAKVRVSHRSSVVEGVEESGLRDGGEGGPTPDAAREKPQERPLPVEGGPPSVPSSSGEELDAGTVLRGILERMGITADVQEERDGEGQELVLRIESDAGGLLIGRHGRTLDALEYLVNRVVSRQEDGAGRIVVDAEAYRKRRAELLEDMARRTAERVKKRTRSLTLTPMSPRDRRVVHVALRNDPDVSTRSIGRGYLRRVIITPGRERDA